MNCLTLSLLNIPLIKEDHQLLEQFKSRNIDLAKIQQILRGCQYNKWTQFKHYRLDSLKNFLSNKIKINNNSQELIPDVTNHQEDSMHVCKIILTYANQLNNEQIDIYWWNSHLDASRSLIALILHHRLVSVKKISIRSLSIFIW